MRGDVVTDGTRGGVGRVQTVVAAGDDGVCGRL